MRKSSSGSATAMLCEGLQKPRAAYQAEQYHSVILHSGYRIVLQSKKAVTLLSLLRLRMEVRDQVAVAHLQLTKRLLICDYAGKLAETPSGVPTGIGVKPRGRGSPPASVAGRRGSANPVDRCSCSNRSRITWKYQSITASPEHPACI